ncbi:MAG: hypothetical protein ACJ71J_16460 [Nitrososphaeraceae archaeon]
MILKKLTKKFAHLAANSFQVAAPTPRLPPVTSAVLPASDPGSLLFMNYSSFNTAIVRI